MNNHTDFVSRIIDYEAGNMSQNEIAQLFCDLANSGTLHELQGHYARAFKALFQERHIGQGKIDGKLTWVVAPTLGQVMAWENEGGCMTVACGCWVEPDGRCHHGNLSWLRYWVMI